MDMKTLAYLVIFSSFLRIYRTNGLQISKEEELEWEKEFKLLQKPSVKLIETKHGELYDCVDFYKQPAFDHPLLKNHSYHPQMKPSFYPFREEDEVLTKEDMKLDDGGCPLGTVPIRRLNKEEFFEIKRFTKEYASRRFKPNSIEDPPGTQFAIVQTHSDDYQYVQYHGVRCEFNIYGANVTPSQNSSGELMAQDFEDRIQVGWTVNPTLYKDNNTHLYQYINAGQSHCFNLLCPGFVSTNPQYPIDKLYSSVSTRGGSQVYLQISIYQDPKNGNWWLEINEGGAGVFSYNMLGYWPAEILESLGTSATYIAVGGEAYSPPNQGLAPMGNGYYPKQDAENSAYCGRFAVLDADHKKVNPEQTQLYATDSNYGVIDVREFADKGRTVFFGGTTKD